MSRQVIIELAAAEGSIPSSAATIPGSQHLEFVIAGSLRRPELAGPPHGHPARWDWGVTVRSLAEAIQRRARLERAVAGASPAELDALWSDPSPEAAELRSVMR